MVQLTPISRERLIGRPLDEGMQLRTLAEQAGISLRCACKGLARCRSIAASRAGVDRCISRTVDWWFSGDQIRI
ncbi:leucine zipper domain-containing protein [Cyanobium sp. N5-Cardenillas]|uniref:leucine zipper domain-containing protein n=1 Tax=Cyanobium sp. N5-Cardenillas TaxID=2823720 RepID=UPI0020CC5062|nr:leucine zipper domain-containing protein [Cyanobium sp. N5-Cardenillas]MCP9786635.1 hypothetical protein [Cyanobium sp. N5-Cardenillas]